MAASRLVQSSKMTEEKKRYSCPHCDKVFGRPENLKRHANAHMTTLPHLCIECGKGFTRSDSLRKHCKALHDTSLLQSRGCKRARDEIVPPSHIRRAAEDMPPASTSADERLPSRRRRVARTMHSTPFRDRSLSPPHGRSPTVGQVPPSRKGGSLLEGQDWIQPSSMHSIQPNANRTYEFTPEMSEHIQGNASGSGRFPLSRASHPTSTDMEIDTGVVDLDRFMAYDGPSYDSFTLPWPNHELAGNWFSQDFFAALQETDGRFQNLNEFSIARTGQTGSISIPGILDASATINRQEPSTALRGTFHGQPFDPQETEQFKPKDLGDSSGRVSRVPSPPNEASVEDQWPFAWNPNSAPIPSAQPIRLPPDHPLLKAHDARFDMTVVDYNSLRGFLETDSLNKSQRGLSFVLPSLPIANVFVGLFFKHFWAQSPVLHIPTTKTTELPTPLIAMMLVIGAIHSRVSHTRRFAIVVLDKTRRRLHDLIEEDNSLMRNVMIIYAAALVCYTGLWCGNKRAFELAEASRLGIVTYVRGLDRHQTQGRHKFVHHVQKPKSVQQLWQEWVTEESKKRLKWFVHMIDSQFPNLLNLPPSFSTSDIITWECPCDEDFWQASSARHWKSLLGPASMPPSRIFMAAAMPFLSSCLHDGDSHSHAHDIPILKLNSWSSFLVLNIISSKAFDCAQSRLLYDRLVEAEDFHDSGFGALGTDTPQSLRLPWGHGNKAKTEDSLGLWHDSYIVPAIAPPPSDPTSFYFYHTSIILSKLNTIFLELSLTDLQDSIGKSGAKSKRTSLARLRHWAQTDSQAVRRVFTTATEVIYLVSDQKAMELAVPYNIIALFLCHVVIWACTIVVPEGAKGHLVQLVRSSCVQQPRSDDLKSAIILALKTHGDDLPWSQGDGDEFGTVQNYSQTQERNLVLRHAASVLTKYGDWGASLNLALLLNLQAKQ